MGHASMASDDSLYLAYKHFVRSLYSLDNLTLPPHQRSTYFVKSRMSIINQWLAAIILLRGPFMALTAFYFVADVHKSTIQLPNHGPALVFSPMFFVTEIFVASVFPDVLIDSYNQFDNFTNKGSISVAGNAEYHAPTENVENVEDGPSTIASRAMNKEVTQRSEVPIDEGNSSSSDTADTPVTPGAVTSLSFAEQTTESGDATKSKDTLDSNEICGRVGKWES
jgi:hypothetical protein